MRRSSTGQDGQMVHTTVPLKANYEEIRGHLKHLGPSNPASNPKSTKVAAVKIKPGIGPQPRANSVATDVVTEPLGGTDGVNERTSLLRPHMDGKDGIQALHQSYNTSPLSTNELPDAFQPKLVLPNDGEGKDSQAKSNVASEENNPPTPASASSVGSLRSHPSNSALASERRHTKRGYVRSGSITENVVEAGGVRKVVLEATSSGEEAEASGGRTELVITEQISEDDHADGGASSQADGSNTASGQGAKKKSRRKKRKGSK
jgi:metal transporter CNNM